MTTRLRELSEAEAYARCYQGASDDVRVVKIPRRPRYQLEVSGEDLRVAFADRLDKREPELEPGPELEPELGLGPGQGLGHDLAAGEHPSPGADATDPPPAAEAAA